MYRNRWMSAYGQGGAEQTYFSSRLYTRPRNALSEKPEKTSPGVRGAHMSPCPPRCISIGPRRGLRKNQLGWRVRKMTEVRQERSVIVSARFMPVPRSIGHVPSSTCCLGRRFLFSVQARVSVGRQTTQAGCHGPAAGSAGMEVLILREQV
jgi:hypothetical protein